MNKSFSLFLMVLFATACSKDDKNDNPKRLYVTIGQVSSGTTEILTDISFGNSETAYICGANGTLLKSADGGNQWSLMATGLYQSLNCIQALDDQQVFMARNDLYSSDNGGQTWLGHGLDNFGSQIAGLQFKDNKTGFILKNGIMKSGDSGGTWNMVFDAANDPVNYMIVYRRIEFLNSDLGFCAGGRSFDNSSVGNILKTSDGGETWTSLGFQTSEVTAFHFLNTATGFAFNFNKELWKTTDGGDNWKKISSLIPYSYPDCYFLSEDTIILKTANEIYHSNDGGSSWGKDYTNPDPNVILTRMKFFEKYRGYVIGHEGFIAEIKLENK